MKLCDGQCAACELNPSSCYPRVTSALLHVSSKTTIGAGIGEWPTLIRGPQTSTFYTNEWVSLWDSASITPINVLVA